MIRAAVRIRHYSLSPHVFSMQLVTQGLSPLTLGALSAGISHRRSPRPSRRPRRLTSMRNLLRVIAVAFAAVFLPCFALAQDSSSIAGAVTDSSGALLPGFLVTLPNPSTGISLTQTTD